ncbi:hypothetical protein RGQ13_00560 [Thalassotalea psychrophila]|uniref:DUF6998 domain-containing protein n=1 Tax=Thalassotalea psychrophila TaxID=3065647 RepID=A0ABY9TUJ2_9GAMM|nr:hypothetical protein RGQ13_00560 [Colwelliaceae bacterium SQ149]
MGINAGDVKGEQQEIMTILLLSLLDYNLDKGRPMSISDSDLAQGIDNGACEVKQSRSDIRLAQQGEQYNRIPKAKSIAYMIRLKQLANINKSAIFNTGTPTRNVDMNNASAKSQANTSSENNIDNLTGAELLALTNTHSNRPTNKPRNSINTQFHLLLQQLYKTTNALEKLIPNKKFNPDGKQVGEIGECLVAEHYGLELLLPNTPKHDARTKDGKLVEIKTTHAHKVSFNSKPDYAIIIKLDGKGGFTECYNGPGDILWDYFRTRLAYGCGHYPLPILKARELNKKVSANQRIY